MGIGKGYKKEREAKIGMATPPGLAVSVMGVGGSSLEPHTHLQG